MSGSWAMETLDESDEEGKETSRQLISEPSYEKLPSYPPRMEAASSTTNLLGSRSSLRLSSIGNASAISDLASQASLKSIPGLILTEKKEAASSNKFTASTTDIEQTFLDQQRHGDRIDEDDEETDLHQRKADTEDRIRVFRSAVPARFNVQRSLGYGHNGVVFAAKEQLQTEDGVVERNVALKFLASQSKNHVSRKLREVVAHSFIPPHPHIVRVLSPALSSQGYEYFAMELCDDSLDAWIERTAQNRKEMKLANPKHKLPPALTAPETIRLLFELVDALHAMRRLGMTHRDIKPSNILLKRNPSLGRSTFPFNVKLTDFGVADLHVEGESSRLYDINIAGNIHKKVEVGDFTFEDDFRAAVATVFFAWLAEPRWKDAQFRDCILLDDDKFLETITALQRTDQDKDVVNLFEHILPTPRIFQVNTNFGLDGATKELQSLGNIWGVGNLQVSSLSFAGSSLDDLDGEVLNDAKLDVYVGTALDIVSGRRRDKSRGMAKRFLDRAEFLLGKFSGRPPAYRQCELYFQRALTIHLPETQIAVRKYMGLVRVAAEESEDIVGARSNAEAQLKTLSSRIQDGINLLPDEVDLPGWKGIDPVQFANLEGLQLDEETKYNYSLKDYLKAASYADEGIQKLRYTLEKLLYKARDGTSPTATESRPVVHGKLASVEPRYQLSRNIYLLMQEKLKSLVAQGNQEYAIETIKQDAVAVCERGLNYAMMSFRTSNADKLEMRRCYAESLCVGENYAEACEVCKDIYTELSADLPSRASVLRVLAIWVASLRQLCTTAGSKGAMSLRVELGYVCSLLIRRHYDAAEDLVSNTYFVSNARAFLAESEDQAIEAAANPLYPVPLLPNEPLLVDEARRVMAHIERVTAVSR